MRLSAPLAAAAGVDPVIDQAGARERRAEDLLRVSLLGAHPSVRGGEHEIARRTRDRFLEEGIRRELTASMAKPMRVKS